VIAMKRLCDDNDSPKHISFIITKTYIVHRTSGPLGTFL